MGSRTLLPLNQLLHSTETKTSQTMSARDQSSSVKSSASVSELGHKSANKEHLAVAMKVSRQKRANTGTQDISVWAQYRLWWSPFLAELILFMAAVLLTIYLHKVMWSQANFPTLIYVGLGVCYVLSFSYNRLNELYLPRPVVFFGLGSLSLTSLVIIAVFLVDGWLAGGSSRAMYVGLAVVPILSFLGRCALMFVDARSTPPISSLSMRANVQSSKFRDFRRKLRFWMS